MATPATETETLSADQVLSIAHRDATRAYKKLERFRVEIALESDGWHIDYYLKDQRLFGGGPHYIIDAFNGAILHKRYCQ